MAELNPDIGYAFRPLLMCCLPSRRPDTVLREWVRASQTLQVRITAPPGCSLPYGQDRLVPLLLATAAVHQNSRTVRLGSAYAILRLFGMKANGRDYHRLASRFRRILGVTLHVKSGLESPVEQSYQLVDRRHLWFENSAGEGARRFENSVTLSEGFWMELRTHPIPFQFEAVRGLLTSPGGLDLYLWLLYRAWRVRQGRFAKVPLFGPAGLMEHFGSANYSQARDFRLKLRSWLTRTRQFWPECPALLSSTGNELLVWHRDMAHSAGAEPFLAVRYVHSVAVGSH
jgi:Plasmid encoded RepA protein